MRNASVSRVGLLGLLVVLCCSCGDPTSPAPVIPAQPTVPTSPPPAPLPPGPFPGAGIYEFASSAGQYPVSPGTANSRFVLFSDGAFALQGSFEWRGRYKYENGYVTFDFDWNNQREGAKGVFAGNRMTVAYNWYMSMADFEDAVYLLK